MNNLTEPIIRITNDNEDEFCDFYESLISMPDAPEAKLLLNYPTVYIHSWKEKDKYSVYVGEANHIIDRTYNHYLSARDEKSWQAKMLKSDAKLYIIAHPHFNKSLTMDIENRMIEYMIACPTTIVSHNKRGNPQDSYYPAEEFEIIFKSIWNKLRSYESKIFINEEEIKKSALFKASPLQKLTSDQMAIKRKIVTIVSNTLKSKTNEHVLIFIEGDAGTGKTVLTSSTFCELCGLNSDEYENKLNCRLLVNHNEQCRAYEQIVKRLNLAEDDKEIVCKPTHFITTTKPEKPVDVTFVDEAHLLYTQGKQAYRGKNQLEDIIERSYVTVVMFDPMQVLTTEQYWEQQILDRYKNSAVKNNAYMRLDKQLRLSASREIMEWIASFAKDLELKKIPRDDTYDIKIFDTPWELEDAIKEKASKKESQLSRLIATYDWPFNEGESNPRGEYWEVQIGCWHKPWNYQTVKELNKAEKKLANSLSWAEQRHTIDEVGSTYTIQGFDLNYAGVILGPSIKYENGMIVIHPECSSKVKAKNKRTLSDNTKKEFSKELLQHELCVLMTRGVNGLYIYAVDDALREALKKANHG